MRVIAVGCVLLVVARAAVAQSLMSTADYLELSGPPPDVTIAYGDDPLQFGQLRLPATGEGPFPVVMVIHGGCWLAEYDLTGTEALSAALTNAGVATWNIEYRRVGDDGGGWPGTFDDVARAADHLRSIARDYPVDAERVVAIGHSAGGHLALWLAARRGLPDDAPGASADALIPDAVVSLAGVTDLATGARENLCGDAVQQLMGGTPDDVAERYALASPVARLPLGVPQVLVNGIEDSIVPATYASTYTDEAQALGDEARYLGIASAGHFEVVAPETSAWREVEAVILDLVPRLGR